MSTIDTSLKVDEVERMLLQLEELERLGTRFYDNLYVRR
jgi:hypothetical protein